MGGVKKSIYIFLCSLLGVLLFVVLHRIIALSYLILVMYGIVHWTSVYSYMEFAAIDLITLLLAMFCGSWYGIWLGSYWYEQVYELGVWPGVWRHFQHKAFPQKTRQAELKVKVEAVAQRLAEDLSVAESLVSEMPRQVVAPVKRRVAKRKPALRRRKTAA